DPQPCILFVHVDMSAEEFLKMSDCAKADVTSTGAWGCGSTSPAPLAGESRERRGRRTNAGIFRGEDVGSCSGR
ncbi:MAG: hypothetical protein ACK559_39915, partial [bacterium]